MQHYTATLYPAKEGGYTVMFMDFPEALTQGADMEEAMENAREALALTIGEYTKEGKKLPPPTDAPKIYSWALANNPAGWTMDGVVMPSIASPDIESPSVRVSVSFTKFTLDAIDKKAAALGMTRSGYLSTAGIGYHPESSKDAGEEIEELGKTYGLGKKPAEKYTEFVNRIFEAREQEKAHAQ